MGSQQQAVRVMVETMGAVLDDDDATREFGEKMDALSDSDRLSVVGSMASVGTTMAQTILSATAGCDRPAVGR